MGIQASYSCAPLDNQANRQATASETTPLFKNLVTTWSFTPAGPSSTILSIDLVFAFANPLHRIASQAVLPKVAEKMVEAFETRANEVYGRDR